LEFQEQEEVFIGYPQLTQDDIHAALEYAEALASSLRRM